MTFRFYSGKNLAALCLFPKNMCEAEFKSSALICLVDEIPQQDKVVALMWIVHSNLIQIHTERTIGTAERTENGETDKKRCIREFKTVNKEIGDDNISIAVIEINSFNEKSPTLNEDDK